MGFANNVIPGWLLTEIMRERSLKCIGLAMELVGFLASPHITWSVLRAQDVKREAEEYERKSLWEL